MAGLSAAAALRKSMRDLQITLIEPKAYVEVIWGSIRGLFDRNVADDILIDLAAWATKHGVTHVRSCVTSLTSKSAKLANGENIPFDVCIVATGARTKIPALGRTVFGEGTLAERRKMLADEGKKLLSARNVLIVGGGAIGVEFAGDLAAYARREGKVIDVTLVHSGDHLVPELNAAGGAKVKAKLEKLGVKVVLSDKAEERNGVWTLARSGEKIEVDTVISSVGIQPCNSFFGKGGLGSCLNEGGWIKVDEYFRVPGTEGKIFAVGDCCTELANTAQNAFASKSTVANNVRITMEAIEEKKSLDGLETKMKQSKPAPPVFLITIGPDSGLAGTPIGNIGFLLPALKNKTMLVFRAKSELAV